MNKRNIYLVLVIVMVLMASTLLTACASSTSSSSSSGPLDGQALLQQRCTVCHDISGLSRIHGNSQQWDMLVTNMVRRGAKLNTQEKKTLIEYLAQTYP